MRTVIVYSSLTKPDLIYGLPKEVSTYLAYFIGVFMVGNFIWEYPFILIFPYIIIIYSVFYVTTMIDPFFFAILDKKRRTRQGDKNKGNLYVC